MEGDAQDLGLIQFAQDPDRFGLWFAGRNQLFSKSAWRRERDEEVGISLWYTNDQRLVGVEVDFLNCAVSYPIRGIEFRVEDFK